MTLENIVKRTDPELIKIFNITNNTRSAAIKKYIQEKAEETETDAEQITSEVRAEYVYHHYGLEDGRLDPSKLLSRPINEKSKKGKRLKIPATLRDEGLYKKYPGIEAAIDIALQYPHRINRSSTALEKLIDSVVQDPGRGDYTKLDAAIYLLSHDKLDNEKHKKTRQQNIEMFKEKIFFHHYGLEDGKLDPYKLLSWPIDKEGKKGKRLEIPTALRDEGLYKQYPGIDGAIDIALQYQDRIDTSNEALKELIDRVVHEEDKGGAKLNAAIYLLSHDKLDNKKHKKTREQIIEMFREKVLFYHYGLEDGKLDPYELLSGPIDEEGKEGKRLEIPTALRDEGLYKQYPGIEGAIDIALQYQDRIDISDQALEELIDRVVHEEDNNGDKLKNAIYLLSHDQLDNEKNKKTRKQIIEMFKEKVFFHHYGLEDGQLDPYKLLSWPIDEESKKGKRLKIPAALQIKGRYEERPGIEGAIDIALQYPDRIDTSDEVLDDLIDKVVKEEDHKGARLNAAIYLLSHDQLDNEKHKKTRKQIIEMFREKVFFHHYGHTDGQLDPCQLLSWPIDEESKEGRILFLPEALRDKGLYKQYPGIEAAIDIALQYQDRIDTTDKALEKLIDEVVKEEDHTGAKLNAAIYFLDKLDSYTKTKEKITRDLYIKTLQYKGFIDGEHIRSEYVQSHPVVNGERKKLIIQKPFRRYVPGNKRHLNAHDRLMMAYDLAINEGFKCKQVLDTETHLKKMHKAYRMDGVKAWYHFNLHVNRDEFSDQSKNWIAEISEEEEGVLD